MVCRPTKGEHLATRDSKLMFGGEVGMAETVRRAWEPLTEMAPLDVGPMAVPQPADQFPVLVMAPLAWATTLTDVAGGKLQTVR